MNSYSTLAQYYDKLMKPFDYEKYHSFISSFVKEKGVDLCCGSGKMTMMLAKDHIEMIGVDNSVEMLNVALNNALNDNLNILWINESAEKFKLYEKVNFVTAVCDGLNYLSFSQIQKLIKRINSYLEDGGYFIFDISSSYKLKNVLGNNFFCDDDLEFSYIWKNNLYKNYIEMDLSFFKQEKTGTYTRTEETHIQYIHEKEKLLELLNNYFSVKTYDGETFKKDNDKSNRILFVCKKV